MATLNSPDALVSAVTRALNEAVSEEIERQIEKAKVAVEAAIRKNTATIAASVLLDYDIMRNGTDLTIRVRTAKDAQ